MKTRNCPICRKEMVYENHSVFNRAKKGNTSCKSCSKKGERNPFYGKKHTEEHKKHISELNMGSNNKMYGKKSAMLGKQHTDDTIQKMSEKRKDFWKRKGANTTEFQKYRNKVDVLTAKQPIHLLENFDKRGPAGKEGAYHLDHIISVWNGFHNDIPPEQIANIENLRMIPWLENQIKWIY
jgi:hypothetical protein